MATKIISTLTQLTAPATNDLIPLTDVSDTSEAASGTTKYATPADLLKTIFTSLALTGDISPTQITSNQNDYNPTGLADASVLRLNTDASRNITSIAGGADGRILIVHNVGSFNIVLKDDDGATGTAGNRFALSGDVTLAPDQCAILQYDATTTRWRCVAASRATTGAGSGDVTGPGSATDNALVRFDLTTGKLIQDSPVTLDDTGAFTVPEMAAPSTPASGKVAIYAKSDGKLYIKDDAGTETDLTATGGAPSGSAGGDLTGTYPNPTLAVARIKADGTVAFTGDQSMGSHKLTNVTDPGSAQDAATKAYVDSQVGGGSTTRLFIRDGLTEEYDRSPASPNTEDDEFNAGSLDAKWSVITNTVAAVDFNSTWKSHLFVRMSATGQDYTISQAYAPAGDFTLAFCARHNAAAANSSNVILEARDSGDTNGIRLNLTSNTQMQVRLDSLDASVFTNRASSNFFPNNYFGNKVYGYIERVSNVWRIAVSYDGLTWLRTATHSKTFTVHHFYLSLQSSGWQRMGFDWVRRDWVTLP